MLCRMVGFTDVLINFCCFFPPSPWAMDGWMGLLLVLRIRILASFFGGVCIPLSSY